MNLPGTGTPEKQQLTMDFKPKAKPKVPYQHPPFLVAYLEKREKVFELMEQGLTNEEIKLRLGI